jgi:pyridoxine 5-phosphate synthase
VTKLSVNINKIALIRNSRGGNMPDVTKAALDIVRFGAQGITVHPRPDERHIRYKDVRKLKPLLSVNDASVMMAAKSVAIEFNIEGYPNDKFMQLVTKIKPDQVTLVPDPPEALTSNAGWNTIKHKDFLKEVISILHKSGIRTSIFIDTNLKLMDEAANIGTDRIELYTEEYAKYYFSSHEKAIEPYRKAAIRAHELGLGINAGHDLNLDNLAYFHKYIPHLAEVSIGHALISDALYMGLEKTVQAYLKKLK